MLNLLLEHSGISGTEYKDVLIYGESYSCLNEMVNLNEAAEISNKTLKFRGKFQEADAINKNKRMYPYNILESNASRLMESIKAGGLCGELDHPSDSIIHFTNASHKITKLWWEKKTLMGEGVILNTPAGKILRALINDGVRVGISSRGVGNGRVNENGILVIGESYRLITFDAVADPSTHAAFQEKVINAKESVYSQEILQNSSENLQKNNFQAINTEKAILAGLMGIIRDSLEKVKTS